MARIQAHQRNLKKLTMTSQASWDIYRAAGRFERSGFELLLLHRVWCMPPSFSANAAKNLC